MTINIPTDDLDNWLKELKPYQRAILKEFLITNDAEQSAEKWLTTTGSPNIAAFGGTENPKPFWERFKNEFHRFLCDETAYTEEKKTLSAESPISKAMVISVISSALGATLGLSATLLAPATTLLLYTVGKMSIAAYCQAD
ncbi:MAG: hypothetical protein ABL865_00590 [Candidatus Nitrotoga sp.]